MIVRIYWVVWHLMMMNSLPHLFFNQAYKKHIITKSEERRYRKYKNFQQYPVCFTFTSKCTLGGMNILWNREKLFLLEDWARQSGGMPSSRRLSNGRVHPFAPFFQETKKGSLSGGETSVHSWRQSNESKKTIQSYPTTKAYMLGNKNKCSIYKLTRFFYVFLVKSV